MKCFAPSVDAVVYYRVSNATVSVANVENAHHSTRSVVILTLILILTLIFILILILIYFRLLSQTTLRNILGTKNLHEILSDREGISGAMQVRFPVVNTEF